ncbi:hypothetical protein HUW51_04500 [Adhaeribacter swui]|uniref:DUF3575 domain-containing protein n=1 Tax=Adhaeribacter swui TaxID=2086471 RepID=A0A7G7G4D8_9BACT|nr:hypothetical protein [Adhaeribacter swui]QNF32022.1 hypothetical protein HUW51_04500 [Adhaeribacter swui]
MKTNLYQALLLLILTALLSHQATAQESKNTSLQIRLSPLTILDPRAAAIQVGLQATLKNKLGFSVDYGLPFKSLTKQIYTNPDLQYEQHQFFKIRAEAKYFMPATWVSAGQNTKPYLSAEVFYSPEEYRKKDDWLLKDEEAYHYDYSEVNRRMLGFCLKVGLERVVAKKLVLDVFAGPGLRRIKIEHQPVSAELREYDPPVDFYIEPVDKHEGTFTRLHIGLGFKIGFILI